MILNNPKNPVSIYTLVKTFGVRTTFKYWRAGRYYRKRPYLLIQLILDAAANEKVDPKLVGLMIDGYNAVIASNAFAKPNKWIFFESQSLFNVILWGLNDFNLFTRLEIHFKIKKALKNPENFLYFIKKLESVGCSEEVNTYHRNLYAIWKHYVWGKNPLPFLAISVSVSPSQETTESNNNNIKES